MLGIFNIFILLTFEYILIECLIPHLNVRTVDKKLIDRRRQDTIDMCRIFNAEYKKLKHNTKSNNQIVRKRHKRDVGAMNVNPALDDDDAQRIESIVDKIYDDLQEKGQRVTYRHPKINTTNKFVNQSRKFFFRPASLVGPDDKGGPDEVTTEPPSIYDGSYYGKQPRFKHGIVPYFIDSKTYDHHLTEVITKTFDYIEKATCIRLQRMRERPTDEESLKNILWLYITNPTGIRQCVHSNDQRNITGVQMTVFGYDCMSRGDITHEVMHVLGFSHEHIRPDRDQYINIIWDNIKPGYKKYFEVISKPIVDNLPYDYASLMHYPARAFSRNGQATIVVTGGDKIGQREGFSQIDVEKISMVYSSECMKRNKEYLLKTCPTVVRTNVARPKPITQDEISQYFKNRLWQNGIVNYRFKDKLQFSAEEKENINTVIRHIEKETCIQFVDITSTTGANTGVFDADASSPEDTAITGADATTPKDTIVPGTDTSAQEDKAVPGADTSALADNAAPDADIPAPADNAVPGANTSAPADNTVPGDNVSFPENVDKDRPVSHADDSTSEDDIKRHVKLDATVENLHESNDDKIKIRGISLLAKLTDNEITSGDDSNLNSSVRDGRKHKGKEINKKKQLKKGAHNQTRARVKRAPSSPFRRHTTSAIVLSRSAQPGCACPESGKPFGTKELKINSDCFNSVNDLLHLFVHVLGLDHQHNMYDRDSFLHIVWNELTPDMRKEMQYTLPPAASVGFHYDYQSVMHYPWLQIKDGRTNIMYPVWNDGWAMGHWQGLSSIDVQKINLIYFTQCAERKRLFEEYTKL